MEKPRKPTRTRKSVTFVRSTAAWKEYIETLAELDRARSVSDLIDRAIAVYARQRGLPIPPKR